jgi:hypothetical protein
VGGYYNDELRKRQHDGDVGHSILANVNAPPRKNTRRLFLLPLGLLVLGILLIYVGPLPGLGMLLVFGGILSLPMIAIRVWLSP